MTYKLLSYYAQNPYPSNWNQNILFLAHIFQIQPKNTCINKKCQDILIHENVMPGKRSLAMFCRSVMRKFGVFFDVSQINMLNKQSSFRDLRRHDSFRNPRVWTWQANHFPHVMFSSRNANPADTSNSLPSHKGRYYSIVWGITPFRDVVFTIIWY